MMATLYTSYNQMRWKNIDMLKHIGIKEKLVRKVANGNYKGTYITPTQI